MLAGVTLLSWHKLSEWPLTAAAVLFLIAYAYPIIEPNAPHWLVDDSHDVLWVTWALFAVDLLVRVALAEQRGRYLLRHWVDVLVIALPILRPLRLLRLVSILQVLNRRASGGLRGKVTVYVGGGAVLLAFCGALAVLEAERRNPEANIKTFGDAMWWAVTTMTTVGYGDKYPTTDEGRLAATALMMGGIAVLGTVTATFASWLVQHVAEADQQEVEDLRADVRQLSAKLDVLLDRVAVVGPAASPAIGPELSREEPRVDPLGRDPDV